VSFPKATTYYGRKKTLLPRTLAIYNVLHFSDDMDKISEGKDPTAFLIDNAEKSQEDANRLRLLDWNDDDIRTVRAINGPRAI
jgi:hypothetical protein